MKTSIPKNPYGLTRRAAVRPTAYARLSDRAKASSRPTAAKADDRFQTGHVTMNRADSGFWLGFFKSRQAQGRDFMETGARSPLPATVPAIAAASGNEAAFNPPAVSPTSTASVTVRDILGQLEPVTDRHAFAQGLQWLSLGIRGRLRVHLEDTRRAVSAGMDLNRALAFLTARAESEPASFLSDGVAAVLHGRLKASAAGLSPATLPAIPSFRPMEAPIALTPQQEALLADFRSRGNDPRMQRFILETLLNYANRQDEAQHEFRNAPHAWTESDETESYRNFAEEYLTRHYQITRARVELVQQIGSRFLPFLDHVIGLPEAASLIAKARIRKRPFRIQAPVDLSAPLDEERIFQIVRAIFGQDRALYGPDKRPQLTTSNPFANRRYALGAQVFTLQSLAIRVQSLRGYKSASFTEIIHDWNLRLKIGHLRDFYGIPIGPELELEIRAGVEGDGHPEWKRDLADWLRQSMAACQSADQFEFVARAGYLARGISHARAKELGIPPSTRTPFSAKIKSPSFDAGFRLVAAISGVPLDRLAYGYSIDFFGRLAAAMETLPFYPGPVFFTQHDSVNLTAYLRQPGSLGERLFFARALMALSIDEAADFMGIPPKTYILLEANKTRPDPETLSRLSELFAVPLAELERLSLDTGAPTPTNASAEEPKRPKRKNSPKPGSGSSSAAALAPPPPSMPSDVTPLNLGPLRLASESFITRLQRIGNPSYNEFLKTLPSAEKHPWLADFSLGLVPDAVINPEEALKAATRIHMRLSARLDYLEQRVLGYSRSLPKPSQAKESRWLRVAGATLRDYADMRDTPEHWDFLAKLTLSQISAAPIPPAWDQAAREHFKPRGARAYRAWEQRIQWALTVFGEQGFIRDYLDHGKDEAERATLAMAWGQIDLKGFESLMRRDNLAQERRRLLESFARDALTALTPTLAAIETPLEVPTEEFIEVPTIPEPITAPVEAALLPEPRIEPSPIAAIAPQAPQSPEDLEQALKGLPSVKALAAVLRENPNVLATILEKKFGKAALDRDFYLVGSGSQTFLADGSIKWDLSLEVSIPEGGRQYYRMRLVDGNPVLTGTNIKSPEIIEHFMQAQVTRISYSFRFSRLGDPAELEVLLRQEPDFIVRLIQEAFGVSDTPRECFLFYSSRKASRKGSFQIQLGSPPLDRPWVKLREETAPAGISVIGVGNDSTSRKIAEIVSESNIR